MTLEEIKEDISINSRLNATTLSKEQLKIIDCIILSAFKDDKEIYTNGTILVPLYRVIDAIVQRGDKHCGTENRENYDKSKDAQMTIISDKNIYVGQTLYREIEKRNSPVIIQEVTVGKIGKKYFYLNGFGLEKYPVDKETLRYTDKTYTQNNFILYRTKEEIDEKNEKIRLTNILSKHFDRGNKSTHSLKELQKVVEILGL